MSVFVVWTDCRRFASSILLLVGDQLRAGLLSFYNKAIQRWDSSNSREHIPLSSGKLSMNHKEVHASDLIVVQLINGPRIAIACHSSDDVGYLYHDWHFSRVIIFKQSYKINN